MRLRIPKAEKQVPTIDSRIAGSARFTKEQKHWLFEKATFMGLKGLINFGTDLPIGGVVVEHNSIIGGHHSSDIRLGDPDAHAEAMALMDAMSDKKNPNPNPDTVVINAEPCPDCQDFL